MINYGVSIGAVVWLYIPEIVSHNMVFLPTSANWISFLTVVTVFPIATDKLFNGDPTKEFFIFAGCCAFVSIFLAFFMVETKDKKEV
jgi:hypothetical protein